MRFIQTVFALLVLNLTVFAPSGAQAAAAKGALCRDLFRAERVKPATVTGYLDVSGRRVYFEHIPAQDGKPTAVIFNGLFVPASDFVPFKNEFQARADGEGVLIFTYSSQFDSMAGAPAAKVVVERPVLADYAEQAEALLRHLAVQGPVVPVGFSYGSAPASVFAERNQIRDIIFVSPLVFPGETAPGVKVLVRATEAAFAWNPFGGMWISQMREQGARAVASKLVAEYLKTDPLPEGVLAGDAESGLVEMIRAADDFNLTGVSLSKEVTSHFILAGDEVTARKQSQDQAITHFEKTNPVKVTVVSGSEHHVIGLKPKAAADAILKAMRSR